MKKNIVEILMSIRFDGRKNIYLIPYDLPEIYVPKKNKLGESMVLRYSEIKIQDFPVKDCFPGRLCYSYPLCFENKRLGKKRIQALCSGHQGYVGTALFLNSSIKGEGSYFLQLLPTDIEEIKKRILDEQRLYATYDVKLANEDYYMQYWINSAIKQLGW